MKVQLGVLIHKDDSFLVQVTRDRNGQEIWVLPGGDLEPGDHLDKRLQASVNWTMGSEIKFILSPSLFSDEILTAHLLGDDTCSCKDGIHAILLFYMAEWVDGEPVSPNALRQLSQWVTVKDAIEHRKKTKNPYLPPPLLDLFQMHHFNKMVDRFRREPQQKLAV